MTELPQRQVAGLKAYLDRQIASIGCDHTLRFSERWAVDTGIPWDDLIDVLEAHGGFCDCEVILNLPDNVDLLTQKSPAAAPASNPWLIPATFIYSPILTFTKVLTADTGLGRNIHATQGEVLAPAPKGAKARKRMRLSMHFFVGVVSGLPAEIGVVTDCSPMTATEFVQQVRACSLPEFEAFGEREAAFALSRLATLPAGTPVAVHFMEVVDEFEKTEQLRIHRIIIRKS